MTDATDVDGVVDTITKVRDLIRKKGNWTQAVLWRDEQGNITQAREKAASFCIIGAISYIEWLKTPDSVARFNQALAIIQEYVEEKVVCRYGGGRYYSLSTFNDSVSHRRVISVLNRCIKHLQDHRTH